jgi:flavin reductase (DIM6/NTAB) family NADH-FMN oxidoreductase RutF
MKGARVAKADAELFKQSARRFASGVTVVTTEENGLIYGLTVSAFSTLSIDPLLVLVCIRTGNRLTDMITSSGRFAVNILREEQRSVSQYFATPSREPQPASDGFPEIPTVVDQSGAPVIFGSLAYFDCEVQEFHADGDHTIFIGSVVGAGSMDGAPLVYFDGNYRGVRDWEPAAT